MPVKLLPHSRYSAINFPSLFNLVWMLTNVCSSLPSAWTSTTQSEVLELIATGSLGSLSEMRNHKPCHPRPTSEIPGWDPAFRHVRCNKPSRWFWSPLEFENHGFHVRPFVSFHLTPEHRLTVLQSWLLSEKVIWTKLNGFTTHSFYRSFRPDLWVESKLTLLILSAFNKAVSRRYLNSTVL